MLGALAALVVPAAADAQSGPCFGQLSADPKPGPALRFGITPGVQTGQFGTGGQQAGGPNNTTLMTVVYLYRLAFEQFKMGYGSAVAWVLFGVIMVFTLIQLKLSDAWVYYEGKK